MRSPSSFPEPGEPLSVRGPRSWRAPKTQAPGCSRLPPAPGPLPGVCSWSKVWSSQTPSVRCRGGGSPELSLCIWLLWGEGCSLPGWDPRTQPPVTPALQTRGHVQGRVPRSGSHSGWSWHPDSSLVVCPERLRPREASGERALGSAAGDTRPPGMESRSGSQGRLSTP